MSTSMCASWKSTLLGLTLLSFSTLSAQTSDGWRGLLLDESSIEEAIEILGKPNKEKSRQKLSTVIGYSIDKDLRYQKLEYKKSHGVDKVVLYFLEGRLVAIDLDLKKKKDPNSLEGEFGMEFETNFSGLDVTLRPQNWERVEGYVSYPRVYNLVGEDYASLVVAQVAQSTFAHAGKSFVGVQEDPSYFPGKVERIQLISRALEKSE